METTRVAPDPEIMRPMDEESASWIAGVNQSWAEDWSDSREDIYTVADGEPARRKDDTLPGEAGPLIASVSTD